MDATFHAILRAAVDAGASDIHLKPDASVLVRVDGQLIVAESSKPTEAWLKTVLHGLLPEARRREFADDREIDFAFSEPGLGRFRVNAYTQRGLPAIAVRLVKSVIRNFAELNLPAQLGKMAGGKRGIVILGGATGSGKSTTLAAMIDHLNRNERRHVITLEDPIEFLFEDAQCVIEQREIGLDTDSYETGLRRVLRQDPDVIVIGEMRDAESARAAMSAANIGRLVFATLHTSDAVQSIQRLLEFFPAGERGFARQLFSQTLRGIVCQRLVRSAQSGLLPATEVLFNTASIARLIEEEQFEKVRGAMELSGADGMHTFDQSLMALARDGKISREEALAHSANPDLLRMTFQGVVVTEAQRILQSRR
ncbi:MAG: PilT/PilU family type 4a pilus ATPase [Chthoniobacteraceae bacterium]